MGATIDTQPSLLASLWRYKWYIVGAALLAAALAFGLTTLQDPLYRAEGTVLLNDPRSSGGIANEIGLVLDPRRYVRNQAKIIESPQVAQRAAEILDSGMTATEIQDLTTATPASDLDAVAVSGTMPTPLQAVELVDAVVEAYEQIITEQVQISADGSIATLEASKAEVEATTSQLDALIIENPDDSVLEAQRTAAINQLVALETRIELLATNAALYGSGVQLYVPPETPTTPLQPPLRNAAFGFFLGGFVAGVWAWQRAQRNRLADNRDRPASVLGAPLLATVPEYRSVGAIGPAPTVHSPGTGANEAYQFAVSSLGFALERVNGLTVLVTSTSQGDGKTVTALNLAIAATHDGRNPLLIDADERARGLTHLSGLDSSEGISDLNGSVNVERSVHRWVMEDGTELDFVPTGSGIPGDTAGFFRTESFRAAFERLLDGRDMVIIDSPPVMAAAETTDVASIVDGIVVVVSEGSPLNDLGEARQRLAMSGTPIVGYIFNKATPASGAGGYGYGYGYGYGTKGDVNTDG